MSATLRLLALTACLGVATSDAFAQESYNVALDGTFAPHAMPKLGGGIEGFNVDLANIIGERLGVEMNITPTQFSGLLPALQAGTYDFIVAPTTITEERATNLLFAEGYLDTDYQFVVKAGHEPVTDLKQFAGKTIAVNKGSVYDSWARGLEGEIGWTIESYGTNADATCPDYPIETWLRLLSWFATHLDRAGMKMPAPWPAASPPADSRPPDADDGADTPEP